MTGVKVTMYHKPNGRKKDVVVCNVHPKDALMFNECGAVISMEHIGPGPTDMAVYARPRGRDEEDEVLVLSMGRSCEDTFAELADLFQSKFGPQLGESCV